MQDLDAQRYSWEILAENSETLPYRRPHRGTSLESLTHLEATSIDKAVSCVGASHELREQG